MFTLRFLLLILVLLLIWLQRILLTGLLLCLSQYHFENKDKPENFSKA